MCKCIAGWVVDSEVDGTHNVQPKSCAEYIAALEELIVSGNADSLDLERVQKAHGIKNVVHVALDTADIEGSSIVYAVTDEANQFPTMIAPYVRDQVDYEVWREEIMRRIAEQKPDFMTPWLGEYEQEHYFGITHEVVEQLRQMGYAAWDRPGVIRLDSDTGKYVIADREDG